MSQDEAVVASAQIAMEGVMAAMRYPEYTGKRREHGDDFGLSDSS